MENILIEKKSLFFYKMNLYKIVNPKFRDNHIFLSYHIHFVFGMLKMYICIEKTGLT